MRRITLPPWTRLVLLAVLLCALVLAIAPSASAATPIYVRTDGSDTLCNGTVDAAAASAPNCAVETIQKGIDLVDAGGTVYVRAGTYVLASVVNVNKDGITLDGDGAGATIVQVSGMGDRFDISAAGVTLQDVEIQKTDKTGEQNIIRIRNSNITIKNNTIHGQFVIGDGEVSRAMVINAGAFSGLNIEGNTFYALRQPLYVSGTHTGSVQSNHTYLTKGWVLEGGDLTFTGNTWGTGADANVYDIAILATMPAAYYTDIVAMSNANNGAVIEDQRTSPRVLSVAYVDDNSTCASDCGGPVYPLSTISAAVTRVVAGGTIHVATGTYTENVSINKALKLRGATGGDFSSPVVTGATAATGVWYTDRYAPAVFESYDFGGEMVLRHGIRAADLQGNSFYNYQGRKLDTNLTGTTQSMSIDLWLDASWNGASRNAGIWSTGFDSGSTVSAYPIVAWRSGGTDPAGFYAFDYLNGGWLPLKMAAAGDYGRWHTITFIYTVGTGVEYFVDGVSRLSFADPDTANLGNLILNVYNFGQDYDVYWDNFKVGSATPTPYEPVVSGLMNITAGDVEVTGLYLTNPGQTNAVVIANTASGVKIANNRIQGVGSTSQANNVHAVIMSNGADQVAITNNAFSNIKADTKSVSAIGVLDTAATNSSEGLLIQANTFTDIASGSKGAYGVIINNKIGAPAAQIKDNTFSGLSGAWTHAIGLEGPTPNAVVSGNSFSNLAATSLDKSAVFFEVNPDGGTVAVTRNSFLGTDFFGTAIHPNHLPGGTGTLYTYTVDAEENYWGDLDLSGPVPVATGTGVNVGPQVDYQPWCNADFSICDLPWPDLTPVTTDALFCVGESTTVNLDLAGVADLYGYQFEVTYDATKASAAGAFVNSFFDTSDPAWRVDSSCAAGVCKFSVARVNPQLPVSGSGTLASITFTGVAPGAFNVTIGSDAVLTNREGDNLPRDLGAPLALTVCGSTSVSGYVTMQGRSGNNVNSGTVTLTDLGGNFAPQSATFSATDGAFTFDNVPVMPTGSNYQMDAAHGLYLTNRKTPVALTYGVPLTGQNTRLWGGDANNSGKVEIGDLSCIGGSFGLTPPGTCAGGSADINADGKVNVQDLAIAGGNYDKTSPQPW